MSFNPLAVDVPALLMSLGIDAQRKGFKWQAHCPSGNHEDAHPSWGMHDEPGSPKHGLHYCFACKFQGTAADLVMHVQDFVTKSVAIDWIVEHAHGFADPVWQVRISVSPLRSNPFYLPPDVVQAPLEQWPKSPREYLLSRGVTPAQVERWSIGYALKGYLNGRVVFPTHDRMGRVVHYTARTFVGSPKRYTTPRVECSGKCKPKCEGACGFTGKPSHGPIHGEFLWPEGLDTVVLTEGVLNTLAVERVTPLPVGCINGSNPSLGQMSRLSRFHRVVVLTDQDYAGDKAGKDLTDALTRHVEVLRVRLPTRCNDCGHELREHEKGLGCRCCPPGKCRKWVKQDPASMRAEMLVDVLKEHGLDTH